MYAHVSSGEVYILKHVDPCGSQRGYHLSIILIEENIILVSPIIHSGYSKRSDHSVTVTEAMVRAIGKEDKGGMKCDYGTSNLRRSRSVWWERGVGPAGARNGCAVA